MEVIGFTNKFYTLWEVSEYIQEDKWGKYKVVSHVYIKNISFDLEVAKKKYPNAVIDLALHGHTSWRSSTCLERYAVDEFRGGKYAGQKLSECTDISYLAWAWDQGNIVPYESREIVIKILENEGYRLINETHLATPAEVEIIEKSFEETEAVMEILEKEGKIEVIPEKNLSEEGELRIGNVIYIFPNFKELEYAGYYYGLPIDSTGKAKRIKNKKMIITPSMYEQKISEYGWGATLEVTVKDFELVK